MKSEGWIDVQIRTAVDAAELLGMLADPVIQGGWEEQGVVHLYWPKPQWSMEALGRLNSILQELDPGASPERDIRLRNYPIRIGIGSGLSQSGRFGLVGELSSGRVGSRWRCRHRTLRSCSIRSRHSARGITQRHGCYWNGLRIWFTAASPCWMWGRGTAFWRWSRCGLERPRPSALGVECDPVVVDCARDYATENGFGDNLEFRCGTLEDIDRQGELRSDLVLANLDCRTLMLLCDELAQYVRHGARLLLSGILLDQEQEIVEAFSKVGAMLSQRREQEGWVALELLVAESCEGVSR